MVYNVDYKKLKEGKLDSMRRSSLLAQFTLEAQNDWVSLKEAILESDEESIFNSCQFVAEVSAYFQFEQVNEIRKQINHRASDGIFDIDLYHKMIKEWSRQICKLRTTQNKISMNGQYSIAG